MNEKEIRECYIRLAFQYESTIDALLSKGLIDMEAAVAAKEQIALSGRFALKKLY